MFIQAAVGVIKLSDVSFGLSSISGGYTDFGFGKISGDDITTKIGNTINEAVVDTIGKVWNSPNTIAGLAAGVTLVAASTISSNGGGISFGNNAVTFTTGLKIFGGGSITIGNTIIHAGGSVERWNSGSRTERYDHKAWVNVGIHEEAHTYQSQSLGPFFFPVYFITGWECGVSFLDTLADDSSEIPGTRK
jgi:hypothetical protein